MTKTLRLISTTLLCSISLISVLYGQTEKQRIEAYISEYKDIAIGEMLRTGVPAAVTLAQGILETGGGQSDLAYIANNHFGIKCKAGWAGETMSHDDDAKSECFRKYATVEDSYKDHSEFLKSRPVYAFLFKLDPADYEGWAKGLRRAGYATNPAYGQKLIKLIVENRLQDYTLLALGEGNRSKEIFVNVNNTANNKEVSAGIANETTTKPAVSINVSEETIKNIIYPSNSVFVINESKVMYAEAGTSLLALANNYNIAFKKLLEYNELDETDILNSGQLIFLEKKSKKGRKDIHIVKENETLRQIAQEEGIQLVTMLEYNGLQQGMEAASGEKIYLQYPAPSSPRLAFADSYKTVVSMK